MAEFHFDPVGDSWGAIQVVALYDPKPYNWHERFRRWLLSIIGIIWYPYRFFQMMAYDEEGHLQPVDIKNIGDGPVLDPDSLEVTFDDD